MNTTDVLMSSLIRIIFTNSSQRERPPTSLPSLILKLIVSLKKALTKTRIKINLNKHQMLYSKPMLNLQVQSHLRQIDSNNTKTSSLPLLSNWKCKAYLYLKIKKINQRKNW